MRTRPVPFGLLLALLVGSFALASAHTVPSSTPAPDGDQHVVYAPLIAQGPRNAQPTAVANEEVTSTATSTTTATATAATATATATTATVATATTSAATATATTTADCNPEADLTGALIANGLGRIANRSAMCSYEVGLASYRAFDSHIHNQQLLDSMTATIMPGQTLDLTVAVPDCATQIDLFYGPLLLSLDGQRYGERLLASRFIVGDGYCAPGGTPTPAATPSPTRTPASTPTPAATPSPTRTPASTPRRLVAAARRG